MDRISPNLVPPWPKASERVGTGTQERWLAVVRGVMIAMGLTLGGVAAFAPLFGLIALILLAALGAAFMALRAGLVGEVVAAGFWLAFGIYQTILNGAGVSITGFFYPFYAALLANLIVSLVRGRVHLDLWTAWHYGLFLVVVLTSFIGMQDPVGFAVVQRVFAYVFGLLVLVQVGSRRGLTPFIWGAVLCGVSVAVWVFVKAAEGGFDYRGDVGVDQNLIAFVLGLSIVTALAYVTWPRDLAPRSRLGDGLLWASLAVMFYGFLLLASRGMFIALVISTVVLVARLGAIRRRTIIGFVILLTVASAGLLLPGGSGLLERFQGESVETGGERVPAWEATAKAYSDGDLWSLTFGQGFKSSESVVSRRIGYTSVHNAYLQILYEFGAVGLLLFLALHLRLLAATWGLASRYGTVGLAITCFLLGANLTTDSPDGFLYWTALGYVAAICVWGGRRWLPELASR